MSIKPSLNIIYIFVGVIGTSLGTLATTTHASQSPSTTLDSSQLNSGQWTSRSYKVEQIAPSPNKSDHHIAQTESVPISVITQITLVPTEGGVNIVLNVANGDALQVTPSGSGSTFIADIEAAQLNLSTGQTFEENNPIAGIRSVSVMPIDVNRIRVNVIGDQTELSHQIQPDSQTLILSINTQETAETSNSTETSPAENPSSEEDDLEIVVTATRTEEALADVPRAVTIISREQLEQEALLSNDLTSTLGKFVPGFGPPTADGRTRVQDLRGRPAQILIDGIPQTGNASFDTELSAIDPSVIERIEVVRGPSAVFGDGATGGVINILTRAPVEEGIQGQLGLTLRPDFEHLSENGFGFKVDTSLSGKQGKFDFLVGAAFDLDGAIFDGEGDRIPPDGLTSNNNTINVFTKAGIDITDDQRLQVSYNFFQNDFASDFISNPIVLATPGEQDAEALRVGPITFDDSPSQTIQNLNLTYRHQNLFGAELRTQAYLRKTDLTQIPGDIRNLFPVGTPPFLPAITQTNLDSLEVGGRFQLDTPITDRFKILWGADLSYEENEQFFNSLDPVDFDLNRRARVIGTATQSPFYTVRSIGAFSQLTWDVVDQLSLTGGIRYENIRLSVDDYAASPFANFGVAPPAQIQGGVINTDDVVFNAGAVFKATEEVNIYANFAQGFSIPGVGVTLGLARFGNSVANSLNLEPQKVNSYELGVKANFDTVKLSLAGFLSTSSLGSSLVVDNIGLTSIVRAPQRNYGIEFTADWQPSDTWTLGTVFTWNEGESDPDDDGIFTALSSLDVQPIHATVYVENETLPGWRNRIQALFVGGRDRAFNDTIDQFQVEGYTVFDVFSTVNLGPGKLQLAIQNLFDTQYVPVSSQERLGIQELRRFPGQGRTYSIRYSFEF